MSEGIHGQALAPARGRSEEPMTSGGSGADRRGAAAAASPVWVTLAAATVQMDGGLQDRSEAPVQPDGHRGGGEHGEDAERPAR